MKERTVEELKIELKETCEKYNTRLSGIEFMVNYYIESLHWTEKEALEYALKLFYNGTISQIKLIGKDGNEI